MRIHHCVLVVAAACTATPTRLAIVDPRTACAAFRTGDLRGAEAAIYSHLARSGALATPHVDDVARDWLLAQRCVAAVHAAPCGVLVAGRRVDLHHDDELDRVVLEVHYRDHRHQRVAATLGARGVHLAWDRGCARPPRITDEQRELAALRRWRQGFR